MSSVHPTLSVHGGGVCWQPSDGSQYSKPLQKSLSSQTESSAICVQDLISSLHWPPTHDTSPPGQVTGVPAWQPLVGLQTSTPLQKVPSSHASSLGICVQPCVPSSQAKAVQAMPSSPPLHTTGVPLAQKPALQTS